MTRFNVVYHIATLNHWRAVVEEQLPLLFINRNIHHLHITLGTDTDTAYASAAAWLLTQLTNHPSPQILRVRLADFEHLAISTVDALAAQEDLPILYFHAKAVSYHLPIARHEAHRQYLNSLIKDADHWADFLAHSPCDAAGNLWYHDQPTGRRLFAGNFWLAKASYIRSLKPYAPPSGLHARHTAECAINREGRLNPYVIDHTSLTEKTFKAYFEANILPIKNILRNSPENDTVPLLPIANPSAGDSPHA